MINIFKSIVSCGECLYISCHWVDYWTKISMRVLASSFQATDRDRARTLLGTTCIKWYPQPLTRCLSASARSSPSLIVCRGQLWTLGPSCRVRGVCGKSGLTREECSNRISLLTQMGLLHHHLISTSLFLKCTATIWIEGTACLRKWGIPRIVRG